MKTILVVDDDSDIREAVAMALSPEGYDVRQAVDGEDALAKLRSTDSCTPSLVLLDMMMPKMSGAELLSVIRESRRLATLPVVVLSAHMTSVDGFGVRQTIRKPLALDVLLAAVHDVCGAA